MNAVLSKNVFHHLSKSDRVDLWHDIALRADEAEVSRTWVDESVCMLHV